jgi:3-methyladenine DNA glycosylase AlkD
MLSQVRIQLRKHSTPKRARALQWFFKTGPGEYAAGDIFIGLTVPQIRAVACQFQALPLGAVLKLLSSKFHEERLLALILMVNKFTEGDATTQALIFRSYLKHTQFINNWDLVDLSAPKIVGGFLLERDKKLLLRLSQSGSLWERRIAVLATFMFIKNNQFSWSLRIAKRLLRDKEDLIHKAVGWMLREIGKKDIRVLEKFLDAHAPKMPRTMLRYAIEKFPERKRKHYLIKRKARSSFLV